MVVASFSASGLSPGLSFASSRSRSIAWIASGASIPTPPLLCLRETSVAQSSPPENPWDRSFRCFIAYGLHRGASLSPTLADRSYRASPTHLLAPSTTREHLGTAPP